ncbi:MAG: hypothetical protein JOZ39_03165 [Chloroflexi bacterium]|nr:hypothetical protein [Chloroflexota bacterium]
MVETIPSEPAAGVVEAQHLIEALSLGLSVVTAGKGALLNHHRELAGLARSHGASLGFSASIAAGLPVLPALATFVRGHRVTHIEALLNSSSSRLLAGAPGQASPPASGHISGHDVSVSDDAAAKIRLLACAVWDIDPGAVSVSIEPFELAHPGDRLVARAWFSNGHPRAEIRPESLPVNHKLASCGLGEKGILLHSDGATDLVLSGGSSSAASAAYSLLADVLSPPLPPRSSPERGQAAGN